MPLDQASNFVRDSVQAAINSSDTTISVSDASTFPDPSGGEYNLVLWDAGQGRPDEDSNAEVVRVTGRDTTNNTLTVSRGQEGTSDTSHPDTSALHLGWTAKMRDDLETRISGLSDDGTSFDIDELVDGAGVSHTGELADASDVSGGYTDSDAQSAINNDADHGSTAPHNYFGGDHADLSGVGSDDHHSQTHDNSDHTSNYTTTSPSDVNSSNWGDYEIQKDGSDQNGVINFKTN